MGQQEIIKLLGSEKEGMQTKEIADRLQISTSATSSTLARLHKHGEIRREIKKISNRYSKYVWSLK